MGDVFFVNQYKSTIGNPICRSYQYPFFNGKETRFIPYEKHIDNIINGSIHIKTYVNDISNILNSYICINDRKSIHELKQILRIK